MKRRRLGPETPDAEEPVTRRQLAAKSQAFNVADAVNALRELIAKTEAFATTADDQFEEVRDDPRRHERVAYLVTEASVTAQAALAAVHKLADELVEHEVGT